MPIHTPKAVAFSFKPAVAYRNDVDLKKAKSVVVCADCVNDFLDKAISNRIGMVAESAHYRMSLLKGQKCGLCTRTYE